MSILWDRETGSLWNHITGQAVHGPLTGRTLGPAGNLLHSTVEEALASDPDLEIAMSDRPVRQDSRWAPWITRVPVLGAAFRRTMGREDTRRPTMDVGLGVWIDSTAAYYPLDVIATADTVRDTLAGREILVFVRPGSSVPEASYASGGERPLQLFTRWYGFALTFPGTRVFEP